MHSILKLIVLAVLIGGSALYFWYDADMHSSTGPGRILRIALVCLLDLIIFWLIWPGLGELFSF
jgi:hypothetical protein